MSQFVETLCGQQHERTHAHTTEMLNPFLTTEILILERSQSEEALPRKERTVTSLCSFITGGTGLLILTAQ